MQGDRDYSIHLDVKHGPLERFDIETLAGEVKDKWFNQTVCRVNDCVVRVGVFEPGEFHWHKHDNEDEVFFVLKGLFGVETQKEAVELGPNQGYMVPRGIMHITRALERSVILMIEAETVKPTGD